MAASSSPAGDEDAQILYIIEALTKLRILRVFLSSTAAQATQHTQVQGLRKFHDASNDSNETAAPMPDSRMSFYLLGADVSVTDTHGATSIQVATSASPAKSSTKQLLKISLPDAIMIDSQSLCVLQHRDHLEIKLRIVAWFGDGKQRSDSLRSVLGVNKLQAGSCLACDNCGQRVVGATIRHVLPMPSDNWEELADHWFDLQCGCGGPAKASRMANKVQARLVPTRGTCLVGTASYLVHEADVFGHNESQTNSFLWDSADQGTGAAAKLEGARGDPVKDAAGNAEARSRGTGESTGKNDGLRDGDGRGVLPERTECGGPCKHGRLVQETGVERGAEDSHERPWVANCVGDNGVKTFEKDLCAFEKSDKDMREEALGVEQHQASSRNEGGASRECVHGTNDEASRSGEEGTTNHVCPAGKLDRELSEESARLSALRIRPDEERAADGSIRAAAHSSCRHKDADGDLADDVALDSVREIAEGPIEPTEPLTNGRVWSRVPCPGCSRTMGVRLSRNEDNDDRRARSRGMYLFQHRVIVTDRNVTSCPEARSREALSAHFAARVEQASQQRLGARFILQGLLTGQSFCQLTVLSRDTFVWSGRVGGSGEGDARSQGLKVLLAEPGEATVGNGWKASFGHQIERISLLEEDIVTLTARLKSNNKLYPLSCRTFNGVLLSYL